MANHFGASQGQDGKSKGKDGMIPTQIEARQDRFPAKAMAQILLTGHMVGPGAPLCHALSWFALKCFRMANQTFFMELKT